MRKISLTIIWLAVMSMLVIASTANAIITTFPKNLAGFNAAAGSPPIAINFDDITPGTNITGATICGVSFLGPGAPLIVVNGNDTVTPGGFYYVQNPLTNKLFPTTESNVLSPGGLTLGPGPNNAVENDDLTLEFSEPVYAFGFDHLSQSADGYSYTYITVLDPSNAVLFSGMIPISDLDPIFGGDRGGADFWGIVSDTANIKKIVIDEKDDNNLYPDSNIGFDTFRFFSPPVNTPPVAEAGSDQKYCDVGSIIHLDGSQSTDPDGDPLTYQWTFYRKPVGSNATLDDPQSATPSFVVDQPGDYGLKLDVTDPFGSSDSDYVHIALSCKTCDHISATSSDLKLYGCETRLTTNLADQYDPAISGNLVVYTDGRGTDTDVWYLDITSGQDVQVTNSVGNQELTDVSKGLIAFMDYRTIDVLMYSVPTGTTTNLTGSAGSKSLNPAVGGELVAWEDTRDGNVEVYARDLATTEERRVTDAASYDGNAAVGSGIIVWQRCVGSVCDIYAYDWTTRLTRQITATPSYNDQRPDVDGTRIVYETIRDGEIDVCWFNLVTGTEHCLSLPGEQSNANISGDYVSFEELTSDGYHIKLWHVPTNSVFQVTTGPGAQFLNDIDGYRIVYTDDRNGQLDIYMFEFNLMPVADAGIPQSAHAGTLVTLDGSGSLDHDKDYPLSYAWTITSKPAGSIATLSNDDQVNPFFTPDKPGDYTISLVVTDFRGLQSDADTVQINTYNTPPVADAGDDQALSILGTVHLDGTQSYDEDGDPITYQWTMTAKPADSNASLSNPASATPTFVADRYGEYVITLVVTDSFGAQSEEDSVIASFINVKPVANAGENQAVFVGATVNLDGSGSSDANNDPLTFEWSIVSKPDGSTAELSSTTSMQPTFLADKAGDYVISLVVNDGLESSDPCSVKVTAITTHAQVVDKLRSLIDAINALDPDDLKNENLKNALTNKVNDVLQMTDQGLYSDALDKLEHDILHKNQRLRREGSAGQERLDHKLRFTGNNLPAGHGGN